MSHFRGILLNSLWHWNWLRSVYLCIIYSVCSGSNQQVAFQQPPTGCISLAHKIQSFCFFHPGCLKAQAEQGLVFTAYRWKSKFLVCPKTCDFLCSTHLLYSKGTSCSIKLFDCLFVLNRKKVLTTDHMQQQMLWRNMVKTQCLLCYISS